MRKWIGRALVVALVAATGVSLGARERRERKGLKLGDAAPMTDVEMKNAHDGEMTSIARVKGEKGTLVVFSCNHCPYVVAWEGRMVALANEYRKKGVGVIFINANDPARKPGDGYEAMAKRVKDKGYEFAYVVDATSNVARAFGASRTPECFLFDAKMKLVYHGGIDDNARNAEAATKHYLKDALASLVAGTEIAAKETPSPGCSIKWRPVREGTAE